MKNSMLSAVTVLIIIICCYFAQKLILQREPSLGDVSLMLSCISMHTLIKYKLDEHKH